MDNSPGVALDIGSVSYAVEGLMNEYDRLSSNLPGIASKVATMQTETEVMAKTLEEKMRYLVDGFEHLEAVSAHVPQAFRDAANANKNNLLEASGLMGKTRLVSPDCERDLEALQQELTKIASDRLMLEVTSKFKLKSEGIWRNKAGTGPGMSVPLRFGLGSKAPPVESKIEEDDFIEIPKFRSGATPTLSVHQKQMRTSSSSLFVRPAHSGMMVPSMRHGVGCLPPELDAVKTTPTDILPFLISKQRKSKHRGAVKDLKEKFGRTEKGLAQIRDELQRKQEIHAKELEHSKRQLQALRSKIAEGDGATKQSLENLICKAVSHIEDLVAEQSKRMNMRPSVTIQEAPRDTGEASYKVMTVGGKGAQTTVVAPPDAAKHKSARKVEVKPVAVTPQEPAPSPQPALAGKVDKDEKRWEDDPYKYQQLQNDYLLAVDGDTAEIRWINTGLSAVGGALNPVIVSAESLNHSYGVTLDVEDGSNYDKRAAFLEFTAPPSSSETNLENNVDAVGAEVAGLEGDIFSRPPYVRAVPVIDNDIGATDQIASLTDTRYALKPPVINKVNLFPTREAMLSRVIPTTLTPAPEDPPEIVQTTETEITAAAAPASRGIEGELVSLLETVIYSQQTAMQGQQALMLEALRQRDVVPVPVVVSAPPAKPQHHHPHHHTQPPVHHEEAPVVITKDAEVQAQSPERATRSTLGRLLSRGEKIFIDAEPSSGDSATASGATMRALASNPNPLLSNHLLGTTAVGYSVRGAVVSDTEYGGRYIKKQDDLMTFEYLKEQYRLELERNKGYELRAAAHLKEDMEEAVSRGIAEGVRRVLAKNELSSPSMVSVPVQRKFFDRSEALGMKEILRDMEESKAAFERINKPSDLSFDSLSVDSSVIVPALELRSDEHWADDEPDYGLPVPLRSSIFSGKKQKSDKTPGIASAASNNEDLEYSDRSSITSSLNDSYPIQAQSFLSADETTESDAREIYSNLASSTSSSGSSTSKDSNMKGDNETENHIFARESNPGALPQVTGRYKLWRP